MIYKVFIIQFRAIICKLLLVFLKKIIVMIFFFLNLFALITICAGIGEGKEVGVVHHVCWNKRVVPNLVAVFWQEFIGANF
jgi:hypothetical protein